MAFTDGNIVIGTSVDVGGINTGLAKIQKSFNKLGKMATLVLGAGVFVKLGRDALDAASDLQEVQNVVDVAFEDMAYKAEAFASTAIEQFGMSEFSAKQTASSFMAMGKSMGLSLEEASDMAIKLAQLTGDFASFYNISQEYARVAMSAVYTGETETLKRYGIVLTEANLQEFASLKGINKKVKAMGAREKAIIRYAYVLEATKDMEGDFVRTQNSWANETRVLSQRWNQFMIVLGNGLITVLTPLLDIMNTVMSKTIQFSRLMGVIISNIFGIKFQSIVDENNKLKDSNEDVTISEENFADSVKDSTKAVKKYLAPFDELNVMKKESEKGIDSELDFGDLDLGIDNLLNFNNAIDEITSKIDNLFDFGKFLGETFNDLLSRVDWLSVYEGAKNFGKGLAEFFNGLISADTFASVGETIAKALNTALYAKLAFGEEFNWKELGSSLVRGVNNFLENVDAGAFANSVDAFVQGLFDALMAAIAEMDWKQLLSKIGEFFKNLDPETVAILLGFYTLRKIIREGLIKALVTGFAEGLGLNLGKGLLAPYLKSIAWTLGIKLRGLAVIISSNLKLAFEIAFTKLRGFLSGLIKSIGSLISSGFLTTLSGIASVIAGGVLAIFEFFKMWEDGWSVLKTILEALGIALAAIGAFILGAPAAVAAVVAGIVFGISQIVILVKDNWDAIKGWLSEAGTWIYDNVIEPVANFFSGLFETIGSALSTAWNSTVSFLLGINTWILDNVVEPIKKFIGGLFDWIGKYAEGCWIIIKAIFIVVYTWLDENINQPLHALFHSLIDKIVSLVQSFVSAVVNLFTFIFNWLNENINQPLKEAVNALFDFIISIIQTCWEVSKQIWSGIFTFFNDFVIQPIVNCVKFGIETTTAIILAAWEFIKNLWQGIKDFFTAAGSIIFSIFSSVVNSIKGIFVNLWTGIVEGAKSAMNGLIGAVEGAINKVISAINGFLGGFNSIVSWASNITGNNWSGIKLLQQVKLPRLASGAVIPPNNEFMAVLGDQKRGTNIEAPLDTIRQAVAEELESQIEAMMAGFQAVVDAINNKDTGVYIGDTEIGRAAERYNNKQAVVRGI